jgi:hypothetical protein
VSSNIFSDINAAKARFGRNFYRDLPWMGGRDEMGAAASSRASIPSFSVYMLPLSDLSRPEQNKYTEFDAYVGEFKSLFKVGSLVNAVTVGSNVCDAEVEGIVGRVSGYDIDHTNKRVRVFVLDSADNTVKEVHPQTIFNKDMVTESILNEMYLLKII